MLALTALMPMFGVIRAGLPQLFGVAMDWTGFLTLVSDLWTSVQTIWTGVITLVTSNWLLLTGLIMFILVFAVSSIRSFYKS